MSTSDGARQIRTPLRGSRVETPIPPPRIPPAPYSPARPPQPLPQFPDPIRDQHVIEAQEAWLVAHAQRYEHPRQAQNPVQQLSRQLSQPQPQPQPQPHVPQATLQPQPQVPATNARRGEDVPTFHTLSDADYHPDQLKIAGSQSWYDWQREAENERRKKRSEETQRALKERVRQQMRAKSQNSDGGGPGDAAEDRDGLEPVTAAPCQEVTPLQLPTIRPTLLLGPYPTREAATEAVMEYAIAQGYMLVMTGSCREKPSKGEFESDMPVIRVDLMCDRGGVCKSAGTGKRKRTTHRIGCPARMKLISRKRDARHWFIETLCEQHNHNLSPGNMEGFATYRRWRRLQAGLTGPETQQERYERRKKNKPPKPAPAIPAPVFHSLATPRPPAPAAAAGQPTGPVHTAALKGQNKILEILLNKGADVNGLDASGRTPLHCGVEGGKMDTITLLLNRGADVTKLSTNGVSVLQLAVEKGLEDAVVLFIDKGADPNV